MNDPFAVGTRVTVRRSTPPGHVRTPYFVRGKTGVIDELAGHYPNPEELAYGRDGLPALALYRVRFQQTDLWPNYEGSPLDTTVIDLYEHWLDSESNARSAP